MGEIWKNVPGYDGLIEVSNVGRVRTVPRVYLHLGKYPKMTSGVVLKQSQTHRGYMQASTKINGKQHIFNVHRCVALAFLPNPDEKEQVNHKNLNKSDNRVENLEWVTRSENVDHAHAAGSRYRERKPVRAICADGTERVFPSVYAAGKELSIPDGNILRACNLGFKSGGYVFEYILEPCNDLTSR